MKVKEKVMEIVFLVAACVSILAVLLICVFLFSSGIPAIGKIGPLNFQRRNCLETKHAYLVFYR